MSRIVQVANFVTPTSGGLRTTLTHLAQGYAAHGHEVVQVVPGPRDCVEEKPWGTRVLVAGTPLPGTGYRVVTQLRKLEHRLAELAPDRLEVHDRTTLRGLGGWASRHGVPSLVVSHERLDVWLRQWLPRRAPLGGAADRSNASLASSFDRVVCTTSWAAEEFRRLGVRNLVQVPLGVDLDSFPARLQRAPGSDGLLLVMASRLSREKRPDLAVACVRELVRRGHPVRLLVAGDGALRSSLERSSAGLPIHWLGFVRDRSELAALLAGADVFLAPGPVETFGLAALEALACGTPAVVNRHSALPEVIGDAGRAAASSGWVFADCVEELLAVDELRRRTAARQQAETFSWDTTVRGFLDVHRLTRELAVA
jgi:alpha-1,6-mannosyltransferase